MNGRVHLCWHEEHTGHYWDDATGEDVIIPPKQEGGISVRRCPKHEAKRKAVAAERRRKVGKKMMEKLNAAIARR